MDNLEEQFEKLLQASFRELHEKYDDHYVNRDEAVALQKMLEDKLGVSDPLGEIPESAWRRSSWCTND